MNNKEFKRRVWLALFEAEIRVSVNTNSDLSEVATTAAESTNDAIENLMGNDCLPYDIFRDGFS